MSDPLILAASSRQAQIDAATAAFLAGGGAVQVIVGIEARYPVRHAWNGNDLLLGGGPPTISQDAADAALAERIRGLVTMGAGITSLKHTLKADERRIHRVAFANGIQIPNQYKPGTIGHKAKAAPQTAGRARRAAMVPELTRIAAQGMTIADMAGQLGVCARTVMRTLDEYRIPRRPLPTEWLPGQ